jgi:hypothetical protein
MTTNLLTATGNAVPEIQTVDDLVEAMQADGGIVTICKALRLADVRTRPVRLGTVLDAIHQGRIELAQNTSHWEAYEVAA